MRTPKAEDLLALRGKSADEYGDYLSHAYLMALQMQWRTASIFAARARERVPAGPPKPSRSNGREALYFEAFCRRYSASSLNDLEGLELLLDEAKKIATAEMKAAQEEGWLFDPVVERFEAEHLALQLSRLLFQWLSSDEPNKVNYLLRMEKMIPVIDRFRSGVDRRIRNLPPEASGDEIRRHIPVFDRKAALENISIRALRNVLAIGLQVPSARTEALKAWTELQSIDPSRASGKQHGSFISEFLYVCSAAHFGDTAQTRRNARRRIEKDFSERAIEKNKTFPYDASRFLSITRQIGSS